MLLCSSLCMAVLLTTVACTETKNDTETVTVTDMLGETITVKKNPKKVACASRTTYDLLIAFGLGDCIDGAYYALLENEWAAVFDEKANERYSLAYRKVLIERVEADCFDAVMKRAIELYFDYLSPYGKLAELVKENRGRGRKEVMIKLLLSSREYGLSDWQAGELIDEYGGEQRSGGA